MLEEQIEHHKELFNAASIKLGQIHWYIQKADTEMYKKCWVEKPLGDAEFTTPELTEFGHYVGGDEINWWVFKKETDIDELFNRTENALTFVQKLKIDSFSFKEKYSPKSYPDLIINIKQFLEAHDKEISTLLDYVIWLNEKDVLAPCILFSTKTWGSTRCSDRDFEIYSNSIMEEKEEILRQCTELAIGLQLRSFYIIQNIRNDINSDIYDSDPEHYHEIPWTNITLITRTSHKILDEFASYFEFIRQSLRNIIFDIQKFNGIDEILCSPIENRTKIGEPFAFISYDSNDKEIASHIAIGLTEMNYPVWYDEYSLKVGDSLIESIQSGIKECNKCILILSKDYLQNEGWAKVEFTSIFTREILEGTNLILPVWVGVRKNEIYDYFPSLADKVAAKWNSGKDVVLEQLHQAII